MEKGNHRYDEERIRQRIEKMRREKEKQERFRRYFIRNAILSVAAIVCVVLLGSFVVGVLKSKSDVDAAERNDEVSEPEDNSLVEAFGADEDIEDIEEVSYEPRYTLNDNGMVDVGDVEFVPGYNIVSNGSEIQFAVDDDTVVASEYAVLINAETGEIVAKKNNPDAKIVPASMTKVLTILVAAENISNYDTKVIVSQEATDYSYFNDCSSAGFMPGEEVTVRDLFYGTILPSGGDAAYELACYVAGSEAAFVDMMNDRLEELGISDSAHFTNAVGLYDENHYCTCNDVAIIMKAALENDFCREVLTEHIYITSKTEENPEGIELSNWFLRKIEDKDTSGEVISAKTGFVDQSGNCAVSYEITNSGTPYICVTVNAYSGWRCIYDHVALYRDYTDGVPSGDTDTISDENLSDDTEAFE